MSEPLSVEQAVSALMGEPEQQAEAPDSTWGSEALNEKIAEIADAVATTEETSEAATSEAEDAEGEAETLEAGEEEQPEEEAEALDPPLYWSQDAKADFAKLPPSLQAVVLAQEGPREAAAAKAKADAAVEVQAAQKELEGVKTLSTQLADFLPKAIETFNTRWGAPDWAQVAQEQGAEQAFILKAQFEQEQAQLQQVAQAAQVAEQEAFRVTVKQELAKLHTLEPSLAPDPVDPTKGAEAREEVARHLVERGVPMEQIRGISAVEMSIARDAMLWRQAQAKAKAVPAKPIAAPVKSAVKPAAAQAPASPQRAAQEAKNRFVQTRSVEDAIALLASRG